MAADESPACCTNTQIIMISLPERARPQNIHELVGQSHLLSEGKPLHIMLSKQQAHSMILWGPPGCGKTTFARLLAQHAQWGFIALSAVLDGVTQVRQAIEQAQKNKNDLLIKETILFVDEVHRFNKAQQDAFLPHIEDGTIIFVGATTENPAFELNRALLSRCRVYQLNTISDEDLIQLLERSKTWLKEQFQGAIDFSHVEKPLIQNAAGDARRLLLSVELLMAQQQDAVTITPTLEQLNQLFESRYHAFDKRGDDWYDMISALHKSIRGSDPDAGLYWYVRMVEAGCDPLYIARRLLSIASEDVGNADPRGLSIALAAWQTYERLGKAEGERAIAHAIIYLACAPKSNAINEALNKARSVVQNNPDYPVPLHLRNAPTQLAKDLNHGKGYRYSHNEEHAFSAGQDYLPEALKEVRFYHPTDRGLEKKISEKLAWLKNLNSTRSP